MKSMGVPFAPRGVVGAAQAVLEEVAQERILSARRVRPAHPGRGQGAAHGVHGVVVELVELFGSAFPVADVGLVPDLPVPLLDLGAAVLLDGVLDPLVDELGPLGVVLRRIGPAGVDVVVGQARTPLVLVRLRLDGERLRHEADLRVGLEPALQVGVEDAVDDRPVVDGPALGVLGVGVRAAPLQGGRSVAGVEEVVGAEVDLRRARAGPAPRAACGRPSCTRSSARPPRRSARSAAARRGSCRRRPGSRRGTPRRPSGRSAPGRRRRRPRRQATRIRRAFMRWPP